MIRALRGDTSSAQSETRPLSRGEYHCVSDLIDAGSHAACAVHHAPKSDYAIVILTIVSCESHAVTTKSSFDIAGLLTPPYPNTDPAPSAAASSAAPFRGRAAPCGRGSGGVRLCVGLCRTVRRSRSSGPLPASASAALFERVRLLRAEAGVENFVVEREELAVRAGVALPAAAADELAVDPLRFVQLGANHVQAAELVHAGAEPDVGAAAGHVRGDHHFAPLAGRGDDLGFLRDVPGVEHRVFDAACFEQLARASRSCRSTACRRAPAGRAACCSTMSSMIACHLSSAVPNTSVGSFSRIGGRFVGTGITRQV